MLWSVRAKLMLASLETLTIALLTNAALNYVVGKRDTTTSQYLESRAEACWPMWRSLGRNEAPTLLTWYVKK